MHVTRARGVSEKTLYYKHVVLPAARRAPKILTVSEFSKREILNWSQLESSRVEVVYNGISEEFVPEGRKPDFEFPYLLYVGGYHPHKNLPRLLSAFANAGLSQPTKLCLTGSGNGQLREQAHRLGISSRIQFLGSKTNSELAALYRGALGVVSPSLSEGFGLPALEAMACGTPALVARGHASEEIVGGAAKLCDPLQVDSIAQGIRILATDGPERQILVDAGIQRARMFTWQKVIACVANVLRAI